MHAYEYFLWSTYDYYTLQCTNKKYVATTVVPIVNDQQLRPLPKGNGQNQVKTVGYSY